MTCLIQFPGAPIAASALIMLGGALAWTLPGCNRSSAEQAAAAGSQPEAGRPTAPRVQSVAVERRDLTTTVVMPGTIEGFEAADLYAKVGGYVAEMRVDIGDSIQKNQPLAVLAIPEMDRKLAQKEALIAQAEAEIAQAEAVIEAARADEQSARAAVDEALSEQGEKQAELEYRQVEHDRYQELVSLKSVRRELYDAAAAQLKAAKAAVQSVAARIRTAKANVRVAEKQVVKAQADLKAAGARLKVTEADAAYVRTMMEYGTIRAPFEGIVTNRHVHPGDFVQPAEGNSAASPLFSVSRIDTVRVVLDVPMNDVRLLNRGGRAVLDRINVLPGESFEGRIARFAHALNPQSRLMRVEFDLANPERRLLPGSYGSVTVYLRELKQTPVIPSSALLTQGDEKYVYVCESGHVRRQVVQTCYQDGSWVGIETGLSGGEQVVRSGGGALRDGQAVVTVPKES